MLPNFANFLSSNGITLSLLMGAVGLVVAVYLIKIVTQENINNFKKLKKNKNKTKLYSKKVSLKQ